MSGDSGPPRSETNTNGDVLSALSFRSADTSSRSSVGSERSDQPTKRDDGYERNKSSDDRDHDDVHIALGMRRTADREQGHHGAVMRQAVQRTGPDDRDAMQRAGSIPCSPARRI